MTKLRERGGLDPQYLWLHSGDVQGKIRRANTVVDELATCPLRAVAAARTSSVVVPFVATLADRHA